MGQCWDLLGCSWSPWGGSPERLRALEDSLGGSEFAKNVVRTMEKADEDLRDVNRRISRQIDGDGDGDADGEDNNNIMLDDVGVMGESHNK